MVVKYTYKPCDYNTRKKSNYDIHINSSKHLLGISNIEIGKLKNQIGKQKDQIDKLKIIRESNKLANKNKEIKKLKSETVEQQKVINALMVNNTALLDDKKMLIDDKEFFKKELSGKIKIINNIKRTGMLYIIQKPKHNSTNIYKVGRTVGVDQRFEKYDRDCQKEYVTKRVNDIVSREYFLHKYLHKLCKEDNGYEAVETEGNEYYNIPLGDLQPIVQKYADIF